MKKMHLFLVISMAILLAISPTITNVASSDLVSSVDNINTGPENPRFLRTSKVVSDGNKMSDNSVNDERAALPSAELLFLNKGGGHGVLNNHAFKAITEHGETPTSVYKILDISGKLRTGENLLYDADYMFWREFSVWWEQRLPVNGIGDYYNDMFKAIAGSGATPKRLFKNLDIREKIRHMNEKDMLKDSDFMFWRNFAEWYGKNAKM
ncbi:hypothetical protein PHMEG_00018334 [Phytophthora megakarya]|uniref:RxLR effector protein n=1 Tax=Phytophthora megakarya TaxID=4795 RepID=A0A225VWV1_9STRA|nr:hypothetical protein PHMEG_00018334 [Phytophthora megakarya]